MRIISLHWRTLGGLVLSLHTRTQRARILVRLVLIKLHHPFRLLEVRDLAAGLVDFSLEGSVGFCLVLCTRFNKLDHLFNQFFGLDVSQTFLCLINFDPDITGKDLESVFDDICLCFGLRLGVRCCLLGN